MQFSEEAAVILENPTLESKDVGFFFVCFSLPRVCRYYWALKSIAVQNFSETVTTLFNCFCFEDFIQ